MAELERPANQRQGVNERARPEEQNDEQPGNDVRPRARPSRGEDGAGAVGQEGEGDALHDAAQRQLHVHHHRVEFVAAVNPRIHRSIGRSATQAVSTIAARHRRGIAGEMEAENGGSVR